MCGSRAIVYPGDDFVWPSTTIQEWFKFGLLTQAVDADEHVCGGVKS